MFIYYYYYCLFIIIIIIIIIIQVKGATSHWDFACIFGPKYPEISGSQLNPFRTLFLNI